ncbi:hypothetical protein E0H73_33990 [Kribbella pittospori]|uniref:Uncharacterized protein n=1 Tax=Kribbella pittospori TaxID=722689 RepID=A0A4R0KA24_9ACTN|nr:hypothetical protein [Kribbella pittospori]TCC56167.1 hypothetical protein E0H73_33990 [Kribbella pittospori]
MRTSRKALSLVAVLALAGCGNGQDPAAVGDQKSDKSPLAEYMGEGFVSSGSGGMRISVRAAGPQGSSEEELAKQRKVEDATVACMKAAGFDYVAVPPESQPKSKFNDAFNLPEDKFAQQYGYGISTIDWSKAGDDDSNPNTKIRNALSANAKKAYDTALNGPNATANGAVVVAPKEGSGPASSGKQDLGCRGKAVEEVYGKGEDRGAEFQKYESLFKDLEALRKRIEGDQRVVDATTAWADCLADAGHSGFKKLDDPRESITNKLNELTGTKPPTGNAPGKTVIQGPPSFDKVDSARLSELRKSEIDLAVADQKCRASTYDESYKTVQYAMEKEFVDQHKAELEAYRDGMANR